MYNIRNVVQSLPQLSRFYCTATLKRKKVLEQLTERSLIKVSGNEASDFLQGLITNDIKHLHGVAGSMFTMFLNTKGRVLYDAIIYRTEESHTFLIECDKAAKAPLLKHLKMYRVRRKVDLTDTDMNSFVLFDDLLKPEEDFMNVETLKELYKEEDKLSEQAKTIKVHKTLKIFQDPRVLYLGCRIVSNSSIEDVKSDLSDICELTDDNKSSFKYYRYNLGVGEGINDHPVGNCFPLECNCDYLHGVSFHKGCYIGQELTARTYHTGVVRKRYMPLLFKKIPNKLPKDNIILHENENLGKLRGIEGNVGLGLIRIEKALKFKEIMVGDGVAKVVKPIWWPLEAPKEKVSITT